MAASRSRPSSAFWIRGKSSNFCDCGGEGTGRHCGAVVTETVDNICRGRCCRPSSFLSLGISFGAAAAALRPSTPPPGCRDAISVCRDSDGREREIEVRRSVFSLYKFRLGTTSELQAHQSGSGSAPERPISSGCQTFYTNVLCIFALLCFLDT